MAVGVTVSPDVGQAGSSNPCRRAQASASSIEGRVDTLFRLALARLPEPEERALMLAWISGRGGDHAALAQACRALVNANEFIHID